MNSAATLQGPETVVVGLDIGGSKTRGIRWRGDQLVADATAGSANVQNVSVGTAAANLRELFGLIGGEGVDLVFAGAGGIDTDDDAANLAALIEPNVGSAKISVVHDTRLLLAAGHADTGVAVIAGTGSAAWGTNEEGANARAGGWGYLLGDEGSGYWFGREAVRYSLGRMNRGLEPDALTLALLSECGLNHPSELIAAFHAPETGRRYWAAKSPVVFHAAGQGHDPSAAMISRAGRDLAGLAAQCAGLLDSPGPIVLGGGLGMHQPPLQEAFRMELAAQGLTNVRVLDQDPIFGVLRLARRSLG